LVVVVPGDVGVVVVIDVRVVVPLEVSVVVRPDVGPLTVVVVNVVVPIEVSVVVPIEVSVVVPIEVSVVVPVDVGLVTVVVVVDSGGLTIGGDAGDGHIKHPISAKATAALTEAHRAGLRHTDTCGVLALLAASCFKCPSSCSLKPGEASTGLQHALSDFFISSSVLLSISPPHTLLT
jgi:hypothetical protein